MFKYTSYFFLRNWSYLIYLIMLKKVSIKCFRDNIDLFKKQIYFFIMLNFTYTYVRPSKAACYDLVPFQLSLSLSLQRSPCTKDPRWVSRHESKLQAKEARKRQDKMPCHFLSVTYPGGLTNHLSLDTGQILVTQWYLTSKKFGKYNLHFWWLCIQQKIRDVIVLERRDPQILWDGKQLLSQLSCCDSMRIHFKFTPQMELLFLSRREYSCVLDTNKKIIITGKEVNCSFAIFFVFKCIYKYFFKD